jgi:hypothetical protein
MNPTDGYEAFELAGVVFPIHFDVYIFTNWQHHRKADVLQKNVGDFCGWHEPDSYRRQLDRLIHGLKAESKI